MNKSFRLVWSAARRAWVVASEFARSHGKHRNRGLAGAVGLLSSACLALFGIPAGAVTEAEIEGDDKASASQVVQPRAEVRLGAMLTSVQEGTGASASGVNSTALGDYATASASHATAVGPWAAAYGDNSVALGRNTEAKGDSSLAIGRNAATSQASSTALGAYSSASGLASTAIGIA